MVSIGTSGSGLLLRRYTRLSNGFSRKLENHAAATALNYFAYNFIKIHHTLRMTPAMAAGVTDHVWSLEEIVMLADAAFAPAKRGSYKKRVSN